jgi:hypothetical protein
MKEFTVYEYNLITKCWDEQNKYAINIDPETNDATVIEIDTQKIIHKLGKGFDLFEKMIVLSRIEPTHYHIQENI